MKPQVGLKDKAAASIFGRNPSDIKSFNFAYEREIDAYICDNEAGISDYGDKSGRAMKPHITILRGTKYDFTDLQDAFVVGGLSEGYKAHGVKNRAEWVNQTVANLAIISSPPAMLTKMQHDVLGTQTCRVISFQSRIGSAECGVGAVFPVVLDGKPCYAAIGIEIFSTKSTTTKLSTDSIAELECARQMIDGFSEIITTSRFIQFGVRNLREFLSVDYPRKYLWHSQVFKLKNTFLEFQENHEASDWDEDRARSEVVRRSSSSSSSSSREFECSQRGHGKITASNTDVAHIPDKYGEQPQMGQAMQRTDTLEDEDYGSSNALPIRHQAGSCAQHISHGPRHCPPAHPAGFAHGDQQYQGGKGAQAISHAPRRCPPAHPAGFTHGDQQYQRVGAQDISHGPRHCLPVHPVGFTHENQQYQGGKGAHAISHGPRHCLPPQSAGLAHGNQQYQRVGAQDISHGPRYCLPAHPAGFTHEN